MKRLFYYNWQRRQEWFDYCKGLSFEELHKERTGGVGTIHKTLFHVVKVEHDWVLVDILGAEEVDIRSEDYPKVESIEQLSKKWSRKIQAFINNGSLDRGSLPIMVDSENGLKEEFTYGEILDHLIAHEIHHMGQMSVWFREMGIKPPSANLIRRGLSCV
ncbi:DinB family protein [Alteribacter populi]|uniref:DinB family protein n=1 Tax=Alteribacter populi TaxID=2011011 RepID=UPI000BBAB322|nr:DinB family protein [Alteribacter populi]